MGLKPAEFQRLPQKAPSTSRAQDSMQGLAHVVVGTQAQDPYHFVLRGLEGHHSSVPWPLPQDWLMGGLLGHLWSSSPLPVSLMEAWHVAVCKALFLSSLSSKLGVIVQSNFFDENMDLERGLVACSESHCPSPNPHLGL